MKKYFKIEMATDNFGLYAIEGVREILTDRIAIYKFRNDVSVYGYNTGAVCIKIPHQPIALKTIYQILAEEFPTSTLTAYRCWVDTEDGEIWSRRISERRLVN